MGFDKALTSLENTLVKVESSEIKETPVLTEEFCYRELFKKVLTTVLESSPEGCLGGEFAQGLSFAITKVCKENDLDESVFNKVALNYLKESYSVLELLNNV